MELIPGDARHRAPAPPTHSDVPVAPRVVRTVLVVEDDAALEAEALDAVAVFAGADVRAARSLAEAERLARRHRFDLALVDLGLPDGSGVTLIRQLCDAARVHGTGPVCVARTVFDDDHHLFAALAAGAQGYLLKGEPLDVLRARLVAAAQGEPVLSPAIARRVLASFHAAGPVSALAEPLAPPVQSPLTAREADVLRLAARGLTVPEVANALGVTANTVKTHVKAAYAKLDVRSRAEAAHAARRIGLLRGDA
ncbi:MAG: LuxR C-terminal-related transcriptional regulator [Gemmatirosa sp.]